MGRRHLPIAAIVSGFFAAGAAAAASLSYPIVGTGQVSCFDNAYEIARPQPGRGFYGQDAQFPARRPSYTLSQSGLTVVDNLTGLTWQRSPETNNDGSLDRRDKLTLSQAQKRPAELNAIRYGGYSDWRLPTIKELYSLITFNGRDPAPTAAGSSGLIPFIDTRYFHFAYGQPNTGERVIDSQYASSTLFANPSWQGVSKMFGVNFADGRIKGYDLTMPGGAEKGFFVLCVRGNENYGKNDFQRNGDGTITDRATALTAVGEIEALFTLAKDGVARLGTAAKRINDQSNFVADLADSLKAGIGALVDADMEEASARLQALQTQQQLGVQALSIANQAPQTILALFK